MVPKWKYDEAMNLGRTNAEAETLNETLNNEFYLDKAYERIKELEDKLEKANKENEWQNKQDVATRVSELDLQHKLEEANKEIERITENNYVEPLRNLSVTVNGVNYEVI